MGLLTKNQSPPISAPSSAAPRRSSPNAAGDASLSADLAMLPSSPTPCPHCHSPTLWLDVYRRGWKCESPTCSSATAPPIAALVARRVVLVDVDQFDPFAAFEPSTGQPVTSRQWWLFRAGRLRRHRDDRIGKLIAKTEPVRCAANRNLLADFGGEGGGGDGQEKSGGEENKVQLSIPRFFIDETLGMAPGILQWDATGIWKD